ncbi:MAG: hypothetical protein WCT14_21295 [Treponemataceae bacterium]
MNRRMKRLLAFGAVSFFFVLSPLIVDAAPSRVAVLPLENKSGDPRYDYLGGIAGGLLQFDLSSSGAVELVDRSVLDAALRERELSLSAVAAEPNRLPKGLEGADYLLAGEYVLIGKDILLTLKLVDVSTTRVSTFSEGGSTENLVHVLAERVVERLAGKRPTLSREGRGRSLLSLRDETPGTIVLHSPLIDAEILLDGAFIGYTTGDRRKPYIIDNLEPGDHTVSTNLGRDFGTVKQPEISFGPWIEKVSVPSGKRVVVTDPSTHFNDVLYRLQRLISISQTAIFKKDGFFAQKAFHFTDRKGTDRIGGIAVNLILGSDEKKGTGSAVFTADGERKEITFSFGPEKSTEVREILGLVVFTVKVEERYGRFDFQMEAERTDVRQGMHRDGE